MEVKINRCKYVDVIECDIDMEKNDTQSTIDKNYGNILTRKQKKYRMIQR